MIHKCVHDIKIHLQPYPNLHASGKEWKLVYLNGRWNIHQNSISNFHTSVINTNEESHSGVTAMQDNQLEAGWTKLEKNKIFLHSSDCEFICSFPTWNKSTAKVCAAYVGHRVDVLPTAASCKDPFFTTEQLWQSLYTQSCLQNATLKALLAAFQQEPKSDEQVSATSLRCGGSVFWDAVSESSCSICFRYAGVQQNVLSFSFLQQCGCK